MYEISYSDFQTLIEKQSDSTYRIVNDNNANSNYSDTLMQICNLMYDKSSPVRFFVDDEKRPHTIQITLTEKEQPVTVNWKIQYKN